MLDNNIARTNYSKVMKIASIVQIFVGIALFISVLMASILVIPPIKGLVDSSSGILSSTTKGMQEVETTMEKSKILLNDANILFENCSKSLTEVKNSIPQFAKTAELFANSTDKAGDQLTAYGEKMSTLGKTRIKDLTPETMKDLGAITSDYGTSFKNASASILTIRSTATTSVKSSIESAVGIVNDLKKVNIESWSPCFDMLRNEMKNIEKQIIAGISMLKLLPSALNCLIVFGYFLSLTVLLNGICMLMVSKKT